MTLALTNDDVNSIWLLVGVVVGAGIVLAVTYMERRK
jgi:hypothetical protein